MYKLGMKFSEVLSICLTLLQLNSMGILLLTSVGTQLIQWGAHLRLPPYTFRYDQVYLSCRYLYNFHRNVTLVDNGFWNILVSSLQWENLVDFIVNIIYITYTAPFHSNTRTIVLTGAVFIFQDDYKSREIAQYYLMLELNIQHVDYAEKYRDLSV